MDLSGRTALVTGAGAGLGRAIARTLNENGATVIVTDIVSELAQETADALSGSVAFDLDVGSDDSVQSAMDRISKAYQVDILVNNAGIVTGEQGREGMPDRMSDWKTVFNVNVFGTVRLSQAILPGMTERSYGRIVNIGSMAAHGARGIAGAYGASKAAVLRYTRGLAAENAQQGVAINAVCPGAVWTPLQVRGARVRASHKVTGTDESQLFAEFVEMYKPIMRTGRPQSLDEVAFAVLFLASQHASSIVGQCLHVDGGAVLRD